MNLVLELVAREGQVSGGEPRKVFGLEGGRIGRAADCEWVLPSPYISRHHATVCCIDGTFFIVSTGENGVALNHAQAMLPQLEQRALKDGDRLFIDEYEIAVAVLGTTAAQATPPTAAQPDLSAALEPAPLAPMEPASRDDGFTATPASLRTAFGLGPSTNFAPNPLASTTNTPRQEMAWNHSSGLADHFVPPPVPSMQAMLPADWDQANLPPSAPPPAQSIPPLVPTVEAASAPLDHGPDARPIGGSNGAFDMAAFLRGAGIEPGSLSTEMIETLGSMVRSMVQGLIEALHMHADFRNQFRLPVTRMQMSENNPLKFAVDAQDALSLVLTKRAARYMGPLEAIEDAFEDIRAHHLATVVGMRAGFESVLNRFDPRKLAQEFEKRARRNFLWPMPAGVRYWRQYEDLFETLTGDADSAFRRLFAEEFARAYERDQDSSRRGRGPSTLPNI